MCIGTLESFQKTYVSKKLVRWLFVFYAYGQVVKLWNGIKRSRFSDTYVIGEFFEPMRNQSGKYSYTQVV